jgi:hypothetical protein
MAEIVKFSSAFGGLGECTMECILCHDITIRELLENIAIREMFESDKIYRQTCRLAVYCVSSTVVLQEHHEAHWAAIVVR